MHTIKTVDVQGSPMEVFVFEPEGEGPHPGIVLAQHIPVGHTGVENDTFTLKTAERLAENGYTVSVPFIFHWWPKEDEMQVKRDEARDDWMAADMQGGYDVLDDMASVDSQRIGIVGHCWGGRVAWIGACHNPNYKAAAIFYGGRIKLVMGDGDTPPIALTGNIKCPVIGFFGNDDENPSPRMWMTMMLLLPQQASPIHFTAMMGQDMPFRLFPWKRDTDPKPVKTRGGSSWIF